MSLFNPTRDEVREFFFVTWRKFREQQALTELEKIALGVIHLHQEYHEILDKPEHYRQRAYHPEMGETNPFLHMSLHLSILEQISIDQPTGIREIYATLKAKHQNEHDAQHDILDCLAETIWQAQRSQTGLNSMLYLQLLNQKTESS